jgi:hypothetical protein
MSPEKGYFTCTYVPGPVYVHPRVYDNILKGVEKHIKFVDENGVGNCKCLYCEEKRKEEFEETYGEE